MRWRALLYDREQPVDAGSVLRKAPARINTERKSVVSWMVSHAACSPDFVCPIATCRVRAVADAVASVRLIALLRRCSRSQVNLWKRVRSADPRDYRRYFTRELVAHLRTVNHGS